MINLLCHCLRFQHFFSLLFALTMRVRFLEACLLVEIMETNGDYLWKRSEHKQLLCSIVIFNDNSSTSPSLASPSLAVRADRMRGGRNKFGPMYKRDRARKLQILRQRQLALQAIRGSIGGGSSSSGTAADVGQSQLSPTGYPPYSNMHIKQEIQIPQVKSLWLWLYNYLWLRNHIWLCGCSTIFYVVGKVLSI